jgi:hypothetical protein
VLVDDRHLPFDGSQLVVDLCKAAIVFGQGAFRDQHKARALGSACSSFRCSNSRPCIVTSLASARSVSGSP